MADDDSKKLFVAGLPDSVSEPSLREWFQANGFATERIGIPFDRATGRPRGFAFVTLTSSEDAARALKDLDGSDFEGRNVSLREFHSAPPNRGGGHGQGQSRPPGPPRGAGGHGATGPGRSGPPPAGESAPASFNPEFPPAAGRATWDEPRRASAGGGRKKEKKDKKKRRGHAERGHERRGSEGLRSRRAYEDFDDD